MRGFDLDERDFVELLASTQCTRAEVQDFLQRGFGLRVPKTSYDTVWDRLRGWSDVDFGRGVIRWRAENDKIGFEHETVQTPEAKRALKCARRARQSIGDTWIFPVPGDPTEPCSRHLFRDWWKRAERLAEIRPERGRGWHSLRRKFATEMKHTPLKDLCYLGGWKDPQTVLKCYQRPDETTMREALANRRSLHVGEA